jgi:hypothetical protein
MDSQFTVRIVVFTVPSTKNGPNAADAILLLSVHLSEQQEVAHKIRASSVRQLKI